MFLVASRICYTSSVAIFNKPSQKTPCPEQSHNTNTTNTEPVSPFNARLSVEGEDTRAHNAKTTVHLTGK
jgi:hypothetical protein